MRVSLLRTGKGESGLYSCCSAAPIRDQLDRSSGKAESLAFSITFGFITKYFPTIRTIYIPNNVPETASNLPKALMLSAD